MFVFRSSGSSTKKGCVLQDIFNINLNRLQNVTHLDMIKVIFWVKYELNSNKTKMHLQWMSMGSYCMLSPLDLHLSANWFFFFFFRFTNQVVSQNHFSTEMLNSKWFWTQNIPLRELKPILNDSFRLSLKELLLVLRNVPPHGRRRRKQWGFSGDNSCLWIK